MTELHADFHDQVVLNSNELSWQPSPMAGVERRMLDRVGAERARASSIVRYAPGSQFSAHVHEGGEEFVVLEGTFEDEHGAYPEGSYVRNPPFTSHSPSSAAGCTIFVKLWQFAPCDSVSVNRYIPDCLESESVLEKVSKSEPASTHESPIVSAQLFANDYEQVSVHNLPAHTKMSFASPGGVEVLVLNGALSILDQHSEKTLTLHGWLRHPIGAALQIKAADSGCTFWMKTGHLRHIRIPD